MQVVLVMFRDGGERRSFSLTRDMTVIRRREDCDFRIPLGEISRKHCRIIKNDGVLRVEDLGSSNGTYVNGLRVQEAEIQPGDTLKLGTIVFVAQIDGVPDEQDMQPATGPASVDQDATDDLLTAPTIGHLNPTAQSEVGSEVGAEVGADASGDDFVITDDAPADSSAGEYDPMADLITDPDDSAAGMTPEATDDVSDDILMDLEAQDHPTSP